MEATEPEEKENAQAEAGTISALTMVARGAKEPHVGCLAIALPAQSNAAFPRSRQYALFSGKVVGGER